MTINDMLEQGISICGFVRVMCFDRHSRPVTFFDGDVEWYSEELDDGWANQPVLYMTAATGYKLTVEVEPPGWL